MPGNMFITNITRSITLQKISKNWSMVFNLIFETIDKPKIIASKKQVHKFNQRAKPLATITMN